MDTPGHRRVARILLAAYLVFLAFVLLNPSGDVPSSSVSWLSGVASRIGLPASLAEPSRIEFIANVLILMPLSFLGSALLPRLTWRDWTAYAFVLSGTVETVQALLFPARSATFKDVVANTSGALLGAVAFTLAVWAYDRFRYRHERR
jgi:glycopeptide antibiotics resistance protein